MDRYAALPTSLVDNDDLRKFFWRNDVPQGWLAIESMNSEARPQIVWEVFATYWNDTNFIPTSQVIPDLYSDFWKAEVLSNDLICNLSLATLEKCEEKLNSMILQLISIITNWERSSQGECCVLWQKNKEMIQILDHFNIDWIVHLIFGIVLYHIANHICFIFGTCWRNLI